MLPMRSLGHLREHPAVQVKEDDPPPSEGTRPPKDEPGLAPGLAPPDPDPKDDAYGFARPAEPPSDPNEDAYGFALSRSFAFDSSNPVETPGGEAP